jgi:hypothetical protein
LELILCCWFHFEHGRRHENMAQRVEIYWWFFFLLRAALLQFYEKFEPRERITNVLQMLWGYKDHRRTLECMSRDFTVRVCLCVCVCVRVCVCVCVHRPALRLRSCCVTSHILVCVRERERGRKS